MLPEYACELFFYKRHIENYGKSVFLLKFFNVNSEKVIKSSRPKEYTTEPVKAHLRNDMKTIRNHSVMKYIGKTQNIQRNTGDLKNPQNRNTVLTSSRDLTEIPFDVFENPPTFKFV